MDETLASAVALGWRVAELYSLVDDPGECTNDTLLPAHGSLYAGDQLEVQIRAAESEAKRAGVTSPEASLCSLVDVAHATAADGTHAELRAQLRERHVEIMKDLWCRSETLGKAYELGNGLSDTYGRVCRVYRGPDALHEVAWKQVFDPERIERLLRLLDDLQSRLDTTAVAVVRDQLERWRVRVPELLESRPLPELEGVQSGLRRQTVTWRQLITGDKEPLAYLGAAERAQVRDTMRTLVWKRYSRWLPLLVPILAVSVFFFPHAAAFYEQSLVRSGIASLIAAAIGGLGLTRASVVLTLRTRLHDWAELLWHRALVHEVAKATLTIDDVFPQPQQSRRIVAAAVRVRATVRPREA
jgi:hypothetical protein